MRILVTGAAGFIGRALCRGLSVRGQIVLGRTRGPSEPMAGVELRPIGDISRDTDWSRHLDGIATVVHLANRAHRSVADAGAQEEAEAAAALTRAAAGAGVRRLVHFSSVRAMGDATPPGAPFRCTDPALPRDPYGRGKLAIEQALLAAAATDRDRARHPASSAGLRTGGQGQFPLPAAPRRERDAAASCRDREPAQPDLHRKYRRSHGTGLRACRRRRPGAAGPRPGSIARPPAAPSPCRGPRPPGPAVLDPPARLGRAAPASGIGPRRPPHSFAAGR